MIRISRFIEPCCRLLLAFVFLYGGIPKLFEIEDFAEVVGAYGLVPDLTLLPVALGIAVLEVVAGIGLLLRKRVALHLSAILMAVFIGVLSYGIWLGLDIDCGCFGSDENEFSAFSGLKEALLRDLFLLLPLLFLYVHPFITKLVPKEYSSENV